MIKQVPIEKVRIGLYLKGIDVSWMKSPFLKHRFLIEDKKTISVLKSIGVKNIEVDFDKSFFSYEEIMDENDSRFIDKNIEEKIAQKPIEKSKIIKPAQYNKEVSAATKIERESKKQLEKAFSTFKEGISTEIKDDFGEIVEKSHDSILRNGHALLSLFHQNKDGDMFVDFAFNSMSLAILLGNKMGLTDSEITDLGMAALVMDVGWHQLPEQLFVQHSGYTDEEFDEIKSHVDLSVDILDESGFNSDVIGLVAKHHERIDGTGYFQYKDELDIPMPAQILSLTDHYNSKLLGCYDTPKVIPSNALKDIFQRAQNGSHDLALVESLIRIVGIYPLSSCVLLNTGEKGLVSKVNWKNAMKPTVNIYYNSKGSPMLTPDIVDLSDELNNSQRIIKSVIDPTNPNVDPQNIMQFIP